MSDRITLYRLFDANDDLMYVGVTQDFFTRLYQHETTLRFGAARVARWDLDEYPTRDEALAAEAAAILHEEPSFNRMVDYGALNCDCAGCDRAKKLHRGVSPAEYLALTSEEVAS